MQPAARVTKVRGERHRGMTCAQSNCGDCVSSVLLCQRGRELAGASAVTNKLFALWRARFEFTTYGSSKRMNRAVVGRIWGSEIDASAVFVDRKRHFAEVSFGEGFSEVVVAGAVPGFDVILRDEDGAGALVAARSAAEAFRWAL